MRFLYHIVLIICGLWISTTTVIALELVNPAMATEWELAPPPPSTTRIDDFEFSYDRSRHTAETSVQITWRRVSFAEEYRVYRQKLRLVKATSQSGITALMLPDLDLVSLGGWSLMRTFDFKNASSFQDRDIPPLNMSVPPSARRPLGMLYCYRVEATGNEHNRSTIGDRPRFFVASRRSSYYHPQYAKTTPNNCSRYSSSHHSTRKQPASVFLYR